MPCGNCEANRGAESSAYRPVPGSRQVRYLGTKNPVVFRGRSGSVYRFSCLIRLRWIAGPDIVLFRSHPDFEVLEPVTARAGAGARLGG
jgi:hypothetical protein